MIFILMMVMRIMMKINGSDDGGVGGDYDDDGDNHINMMTMITINCATALINSTLSCSVSTSIGSSAFGSYLNK